MGATDELQRWDSERGRAGASIVVSAGVLISRGRGIVIEFAAHLPLMDFGGYPYTLAHLIAYTRTAAQLGFGTLSVNDHMIFSVPWLDGPIALAAVMDHSEQMTRATTVCSPRGLQVEKVKVSSHNFKY